MLPLFFREQSMTEEEVLYAAFHAEHGVEVELLGNFQTSLQRLYAARRKDPDLEILQLSRKPGDTTAKFIWIVKRDPAQQPTAKQQLKENPKGDGPLFSLADLLGDD